MKRVEMLLALVVIPLFYGVTACPARADSSPPQKESVLFTVAALSTSRRYYGEQTWLIAAVVPAPAAAAARSQPHMAARLARFFHRNLVNPKRWRKLQIFVFKDDQPARQFAAYQRKRNGQPLRGDDYARLSPLWSKVTACYVNTRGKEKVFYLSRNPSGWWQPLPIRL